jgi:hypothetical protein
MVAVSLKKKNKKSNEPDVLASDDIPFSSWDAGGGAIATLYAHVVAVPSYRSDRATSIGHR